MLRTLAILVLVSLAGGADLLAQDRPYRPWLEGVLLSKCEDIAVGRLVDQSLLPSRDRLLTFAISTRLKGKAEDRVLAVGAGREILSYPEMPKLLFLSTRGSGYLQTIIDFVDLPESGGRERVDFLKSYLDLIQSDDLSAVARRMKRLALDHLPARNTWVRRIVVRELRVLAETRSSVFDAADLISLREVKLDELPERERAIMREAIHFLEEGKALAWTRGSLVFPDEESRISFFTDLATFERGGEVGPRIAFLDEAAAVFGRKLAPYVSRCLGDESPEVARHAADLLGEMESGAGLGRLEDLALRSKDMEMRRAAIKAIGKIGSMRSVPALIRCLEPVELQRDVLVALVSVNTAEAALAVKDFDERLRKQPGADPELRRFVTRIRGDEFMKILAAERVSRQKRWER